MKEIENIDLEKVIYIDESGMNDNDFYPYEYSEIGKRHYETHPGHYTKRISMIGGLCNEKLLASFMFEGHCNHVVFELYVEKILVPILPVGITVIVDNASFHRSEKARKLIEEAGGKLMYLPPYSPDLNPIEHYWHKIKTAIRKVMRNSKFGLQKAMENVLKSMATC